MDSSLNFIDDKTEWNGTKVTFEIAKKGGKTEVRFTHVGLAPDSECYEGLPGCLGLVRHREPEELDCERKRGSPTGRRRRAAFGASDGLSFRRGITLPLAGVRRLTSPRAAVVAEVAEAAEEEGAARGAGFWDQMTGRFAPRFYLAPRYLAGGGGGGGLRRGI